MLSFVKVFLAVAWATSSSSIRLCYISPQIARSLPRALDLSSQHVGYRVAIAEFNRRYPGATAEFEVIDPSLDMFRAVDRAADSHCTAVVGLVRSQDALLAAPRLQAKELMGFSSTAKSPQLQTWYPTVMSASTSVDGWVEDAVAFLSRERVAQIVIIAKGDDATSLIFAKSASQRLGKRARVIYLNYRLEIDAAQLNNIFPYVKTAFLHTTYPFAGLPSLRQLAERYTPDTNWLIVANHTWTEVHTLVARPDILDASPPIYTLTPWDVMCPNDVARNFFLLAEREIGRPPDHDSSFDFDVANMILHCAEDSGVEEVQGCLKRPFTHRGVTGDYVFEGDAHPRRPHFLYQITRAGLQKVGGCE